LDEVVLRALEKEPDNRYQHVSELEKEVATIAAGSGTTLALARSERRTRARVSSAPFRVDLGLSNAHGLIRIDDDHLMVEYVIHYMFSFSKSPPKEKTIPLRDIATITLKKGKLILTAHRLSILEGVPGSRPGFAELVIDRPHRKTAEQLVDDAMR